MAALLGRMVELGYGVAYRVLDAQYFGVPQRRRRVFIIGLRSDSDDVGGRAAAERAAAVLSVGARCGRHPASGHEAGPGAAEPTTRGVVGTLNFGAHIGIAPDGQSAYSGQLIPVSPSPDADGVRAPDGLAGRAHDQQPVEAQVVSRDGVPKTAGGLVTDLRAGNPHPSAVLAPTLRVGPAKIANGGPGDTVPVIAQTLNSGGNNGGFRTEPGAHLSMGDLVEIESPDLPLGLDSHRYRCCGNGVVAPVAEWLGLRLREALA